MNPVKPTTVEAYLTLFEGDTLDKLKQLRQIIRDTAPDAQEVISYGMPAYKQNGILVYFAGYKNHIGFYPTGKGITPFADRITGFKTSKGTIQFTLDKPLPEQLIRDIVQYRINENNAKTLKKR